MLNSTRVLEFVKIHLGFPILNIELSDEQIMNHISTYSLREFSYYVPHRQQKINLNLDLDINKVPGIQNEYYLTEPDQLEILNVVDVYFSASNLIFHGHPPIGPLSQGELRNFALDVATSMMIKLHSSWDYTFEFKHPNVLRISPVPTGIGNVTVEYEREQPTDFSGIPNDLQMWFCEFALADIQIIIGTIRRKYSGQTRTPFGEIPLNDNLLDEGKEKKNALLDKLQSLSVPNVRIDVG